MQFNNTKEIIDDLADGKMVIIADDEKQESEGDLMMAASLARPQDVNFMARYGKGLICLTLTRERCQQLNLSLMASDTDEKHRTNFTVSIEAREGVTTGISAYDRAHTIRTAVAPDAKPSDVVQPGHVFPVMSQPGGVLNRAGHTEAGCDLVRLANLEPASVIVDILDDDGTMARRPRLEKLAEAHHLKIGTIEDLIRYRIVHEPTVIKISECPFMTDFGLFRLVGYKDTVKEQLHFALVKGSIEADRSTLVRVHIENTLSDSLLGSGNIFGWPLRDAIKRIAQENSGVVVLLRLANDVDLLLKQIQTGGLDDTKKKKNINNELIDRRTLGIGGQILFNLKIKKMRLLSAPQIFHGLGGFGLEIQEYIAN